MTALTIFYLSPTPTSPSNLPSICSRPLSLRLRVYIPRRKNKRKDMILAKVICAITSILPTFSPIFSLLFFLSFFTLIFFFRLFPQSIPSPAIFTPTGLLSSNHTQPNSTAANFFFHSAEVVYIFKE